MMKSGVSSVPFTCQGGLTKGTFGDIDSDVVCAWTNTVPRYE